MEDRARLLDLLTRLASRGVALVFDSNYRAALWPSKDVARAAMTALFPATRLILVTFDDEQQLWGDDTPAAAIARLHAAKARFIVMKLGAGGCVYSDDESAKTVATSPVANVVDTTAAGDAFNAGFLTGWLLDRSAADCCRAGNALAGVVIQHRGAIIPASVTPSFPELLAP
jgi:2-dehydro-3-deoxygluconokinase